MRECGAAGMAALEFRLVEMHAMREERAPAGETVVGIDVEIVAPLREQLHHQRNFVLVLRNMGLHEGPGVLAPECPCELQLLGGAASGISRRNGVEATSAPVPLVDQHLRLVVTGASGIGERGRCVAVHQDLPRNEPQVVTFRFREQRVDRARMH